MWLDVDKNGLARLLEKRCKSFILFELLQNAWDTPCTQVDVRLLRMPGTRRVRLVVEDDAPDGFSDLRNSYTMFADSEKKGDATKRGRFNIGDKFVLAMCDEAEIASTTGTIRFDNAGRHRLRRKLPVGSRFSGVLKMTDAELTQCAQAMRRLIPPSGVRTVFNGEVLEAREPVAEFSASLPTEVADAEGVLRRATRLTLVRLYEPAEGAEAGLHELGVPVVAAGGDRWDIDVQQKVPLNLDRDNVQPSYLARLRSLVLEHMAARIDAADANEGWVREALHGHAGELSDATIARVIGLRFGPKRVAYDPSDPEANQRAAAAGYTVIHGAQLSKPEWEAVRRSGAVLPAGRVTPSPKPFSPDGVPLALLQPDKWTPAVTRVVRYCAELGRRVLGVTVRVSVASDVTWPFSATFGDSGLILNLGRLGHRWFEGDLAKINALLIHEFAHFFEANHLSDGYHEALCEVGAKVVALALDEPGLFDLGGDRA